MDVRFSQSAEPLPHGPLELYFENEGEIIELSPDRGGLPAGSPAPDAFSGNAPLTQSPMAAYVEKGWLNRIHDDECGHDAITATYIPGDIINLDTLVEAEPIGRICALNAARMKVIPVPMLRAAMEADFALTINVIQRLVAEADWLREALSAMGRLDAKGRIIYYFGQMRRRQIAYGTLDRQTARYPMPITQRHLATMVGISVIHANRLTKELRETGLLTLRAKTISLLDIDAFEKAFAALIPPG
ncbi:MAG: Crp/Fnr family transcriptional regulator [Pontixanthobacter sp.]